MTPGRRRLLLGTLALSGAGLLIDTLVRAGAPRPAVAAPGSAAASAASSSEIEPADLAQVLASLHELPGQTPAWASLDMTRDPFEMPEELRPIVAAPPEPPPVEIAPAAAVAPAEEQAAPAGFEDLHILDGILHGPCPVAIVDGRTCRVGSLIGGYRLTAIEREYVVFQRAGEQAILRLPPPKPE